MKLSPWITSFLDYLDAVGKLSYHTVRAYSIDLEHFKKFIEKKDLLLNKKSIRSYIAHLSDKYDASSISRRLSALRSFFKFCRNNGWIKENPIDVIPSPKKAKKLPSLLSLEQIQKLLDLPNVSSYLGLRDKAILELFYSSALRLSELISLDRQNISFEELFIKVKGKGDKERYVPITNTCSFWLEKYLNHKERLIKTNSHKAESDHKAVFLNKWGDRITSRSVDRLFAYYVREARLPKVITPHTMRHSIATHFLDNGMSLDDIQKILGHEDISSTTIYTQVSMKKKLETYSRCFPEEKLKSPLEDFRQGSGQSPEPNPKERDKD